MKQGKTTFHTGDTSSKTVGRMLFIVALHYTNSLQQLVAVSTGGSMRVKYMRVKRSQHDQSYFVSSHADGFAICSRGVPRF